MKTRQDRGIRPGRSVISWLGRSVYSIAWLASVIPALAASNWSLFEVGRHYGLPVPLAAVLSLALDGSAIVAADIALRHARERGASGTRARFIVVMSATISAVLNQQHAVWSDHGSVVARLLFAAPAVIALLVFETEAQWQRREALYKAGRIADPLPSFGIWSWVYHPYSTFRTLWRITQQRREVIETLEKTRTDSQLVLNAESATITKRAYHLPKPIRGADGNILPCTYCDNPVAVHMDHIHPRSRGGSDDVANLVPACMPCNLSKSAKLLSDWLPERVAYAVGHSDKVREVFNWQQSEWAELDKLQRVPRAEAIRIALSKLGDQATTSDIESWLSERGILVDSSYIRLVRSRADGSVDVADQERNTGATLVDMSATLPDASTNPDDIWDAFANAPATSSNGSVPAGDQT